MTQPEQRQALVDTFINAIYLYDDKVLITFNYKEGTETVAFGEAVRAEKSSDMSARGAPKAAERKFCSFFVYLSSAFGENAQPLSSTAAGRQWRAALCACEELLISARGTAEAAGTML